MTSRIRIEKDVPISQFYLAKYERYASMRTGTGTRQITGKGRAKFPFKKMEVGDSFMLPLKMVRSARTTEDATKSNSNYPYEIRLLAKAWGALLNKTFLVLKDDNHQWRCWRTE